MADKLIPIRYIGKKDTYRDHLYGSGLTFVRDDITLVPGYLYDSFVKHPEFVDARVGKMKARDIDRTQPKKVEDERDEPPLMNLEGMTKENLSMYAKRNFNLDLSGRTHKSEMVEIVRRQMGTDMPVNY